MNVTAFEKFLLRRKSKDYVYGIWVYKALDIWKGYYRVKKIEIVISPVISPVIKSGLHGN